MKLKTEKQKTDQRLTLITNILAGIILCVLLFWGGKSLWRFMKYTYTNDAQVTQYINPVISRVGGYIVEVNFQDHQPVKRGDTLLIIDNKEYKYEAEQALASLRKEDAEITVLSSKKQILIEEHESLQKSIAAHEAKVKKQQLEYDRYKYLYDQKSATSQQLEEVEAILAVYKSDLASLKHKLDASQERISDIDVQKNVIGAEKNRLSAAAGRKDLDVGYTIIRAPYDGIMGKRSIEKGQMVKPAEVLGYIVNAETPVWITANFKETQLRFLALDDEVEVVADAFPDKIFKGKIISLSPATGSSFSLLPPDNSTGNFVKIVQRVPVRIELDSNQEEQLLRSGMNVNVSVPKK